MGKIRTKHVLIMVAQEQKKKFCLMDEILQWSFTDRSYILALAFYESCYIHPFWLYHHAIIGCFYFHVSKKLRS